jgi:hypothetical protein
MTSLSDTLTVGLVLVLIFGSIALYLYTRIQQAEQKISLLESILLELKMSSEVKSYSELPASDGGAKANTSMDDSDYVPFSDGDNYSTAKDDSDDYYPGAVIDASDLNIKPKSPSPTPSVSSKLEELAAEDIAEVEQYKSVIAEAVDNDEDSESLPKASKVSVNYESMTLKELQTLAKSRGITGAGSMKKGPIIEALKTSDRSQGGSVEPGSTGISSFLETSSSFRPEI